MIIHSLLFLLTITAGVDLHFRHESELPVAETLDHGQTDI